ncbi:hypothetical protein AQUCO_00100664v1 [Aquilegia coerulea]|uniref:Fe2OG dioxygenase domain-containing protein n=1 Tax=Aquilegia coerulea TaxID=218851 RepID=A0A2G5FBN1_AQUCA|nr:hypothetical protein AQUCO_00100664v1 [Aquilegia coerulea]
MGTISSDKVPAINFTKKDVSPGTSTWRVVRTKVGQALEKYGCFEAVFDDKPQLHQNMLGALEQYFDLPREIKTEYMSNKAFDGYTGVNPPMPLFENVIIHTNGLSLVQLERFTNLMWPEGNSSFWVLSFSCGIYNYIVRLNKYNAPRTKETIMGVVPHKDKSFVSILGQNDVHGLEIQTKDGEWITMEPSASSFVVMIGEVFMAWSNDRLHCPLHRVMMTGDEERYSMALFSHSKGIVETPEEMVDEEHPLLYKPFSHSAYYIFAQTKGAQKFESQIKAFCGV